MAIRDFGESILADVRKRNDDQRRRDEGGTLGKIQRGLKTVQDVAEIGQSFGFFGGTQDDKYNKFKTNKDVMDTNINIGRAETNAAFYDATKKAIEASNYSTGEYFLDQTVKETIDASLKLSKNAQYALDKEAQDKYRITYGAELRKLDKVKEAAKYATDQYTKFGVVRDRFSQTGTIDEAMELAKSKLPKTLRSLGSIFTGEDLNQAAVDSYTTGLRAQGATQVQVFEQILEATGGNFTQAVDLAEEAGISEEALESATKTVTKNIDTGDGSIVSVQYKEDIFGVETLVAGSAKRTDLRTEEQRVAVKKANFNPQGVIVSQLNKAGQIKAKELGFVRGQVTTEAVYEKNVKILNDLLNAVDTETGNTLYIKPLVSEIEKSRNQLRGNLVGALYRDVDFLRAQTDVEKQSGFMEAEREKIVALHPKLGDKEIETLLLENNNYKSAYASFAVSTSTVINKQNSVNDVVNATFPSPTNPDDAETANIKAGSTSTTTPVIVTTGKSSTVTKEQVSAAVSGEISDADAKAWAKKNNYGGISAAQIRREHTAEVIADRDNPTIKQKVAEVIDNVSAYQKEVGVKNDLHRAKIKEMSDGEKYYFNQTLNYPDRIVEMFKDGIPTPPITKSNRSSSLLGPVNKEISNFGVN